MQMEQIGTSSPTPRRAAPKRVTHPPALRPSNGHGRGRAWRWLRIGLEAAAVLALAERALHRRRGRRTTLVATTAALAGVALLDTLAATHKVRTEPLRLRASVTVNNPPEEVYAFWRDFKNLPTFMRHLEEVDEFDGLTIWRARGPGGIPLQWDAAIVAERPNERIAWRSLEGADLQNYGSVTFLPGPCGRGTEVHVTLGFEPPFLALGTAVVKLLGAIPEQQLRADLRRFKQMLETGGVATSDASVHRGRHPARPPEPRELPLVKGLVRS
jgi:uncharacterized membrane protein